MNNAKPLAALVLTGLGTALVATFQVADPQVISATTGTTASNAATPATTAAPTTATSNSTTAATAPRTTAPTTATPAPTAAATAGPTTATATFTDGTYAGAAVGEPWGTFQVQATISAGKLTNVTVVAEPIDNHSSRINSQAVPLLTQSAIAAQSAQIDAVSGATWTSDSYMQSLQAALDAARAAAVTTTTAG